MTYQSFDGHGVDVAANRADSLDKQALAYIVANPGATVVDLGSGVGGQSARMVEAGARVTAIDQFDFSSEFESYGYSTDTLRFVCGDVRSDGVLSEDSLYDVALCQRMIHYLRYDEAASLLIRLRKIVRHRLYISVTGTGSLVGDTYKAAIVPIAQRFSQLSALGQEMFSISEPVCLYSETEFKDLLIDTGWQIDSCRVTAFGNIQAICNTTSQS